MADFLVTLQKFMQEQTMLEAVHKLADILNLKTCVR